MTLKRLFEKMTNQAEECMQLNMVTQAQKADYEKKIAALEGELLQTQEVLRLEREKSASEIKLLQESLKFAHEQIEELKGTIKKLQHYKYGHSSEQSKYLVNSIKSDKEPSEPQSSINQAEFEQTIKDIKADVDEVGERRKKGGQKGHKGTGRRIPKNLKKITHVFELSEEECKCPICGKKYRLLNEFVRKSHEIDLQIELFLKEYSQYVYERECNCDRNAPLLIVAPKPENIIYKSAFTTSTWCKLLALKYLTGIPVNRFNELTNELAYEFNPSTILGGFEKLLEIMRPLYQEVLKYNQNEPHWHADETRWCRLLDSESQKRRLYWIWVFVGKRSVVYLVDPTRSKSVPEKHFKNTKEGILNVDRFPSYNVVSEKIILAYCWYHLRRDFINVGKKHKNLMQWSISWLLKIREIERINRRRSQKHLARLPYQEIQEELCKKVNEFFEEATRELTCKGLNKDQTKTFKSLLAKRAGYTVFVDHAEIPLHNNVAESQFRHVAYARNNYGGSKSEWGGEIAVVTWTIFKTAQLNGLNPVNYLMNFFQKYIDTNGFPHGIPEDILPWNCTIPRELPNSG